MLTKYPLQSLLKRSDFTSRIAKWGIWLNYFDIQYRPRNSVKGQVLANFVAEFSLKRGLETVCHVEVWPWRVFVDGASSALGAGARIIIITVEGIRVEYSFRLSFKASNNEVEYEALLAGVRAVLEVYSDSRLVVNQVVGNFEAKNPWMISYFWLVKQTMSQFQNVRVIQIARGQNRHIDSLATLASSLTEEVP